MALKSSTRTGSRRASRGRNSVKDDSEAGFRLIVDSIPGLVFTTSVTTELEYANRPLLEYFGKTLEELQAWRIGDSVHPDDRPRVAASFEQGIASGHAFEGEHRLRRADGAYRWFHLRIAPHRNSKGALLRWYGIANDVHDLKMAEQESRSSERDLRMLVDNIPGLIYTTTASYQLEIVNRRVLEYFGRTLEELKQWDRIGVVHPDDMPTVLESVRRAIEYGEPHEVEQRLRRADGVYRWFKPHSLPLRDAQGRTLQWYCTLTDIDDRKRAEETLRSMQARLARAVHFAALSELSASIAHELNQPLAAVVAHAQACQRWLSVDPPNVERARLSADRLVGDGSAASAVIQRIRLLFKHASPAKTELSINDVIEQVCSLVSDDLRAKDVLLDMDLCNHQPRTLADCVQVQQVIVNLVRNGIDAMDEVTDRPKRLLISSRCDDGEISVHVADQGIGIVDAQILFEPFYTTKAHGMGMGLAICRSIIEAHGGRLWAASNEQHGATFSFALPARESSAE